MQTCLNFIILHVSFLDGCEVNSRKTVENNKIMQSIVFTEHILLLLRSNNRFQFWKVSTYIGIYSYLLVIMYACISQSIDDSSLLKYCYKIYKRNLYGVLLFFLNFSWKTKINIIKFYLN